MSTKIILGAIVMAGVAGAGYYFLVHKKKPTAITATKQPAIAKEFKSSKDIKNSTAVSSAQSPVIKKPLTLSGSPSVSNPIVATEKQDNAFEQAAEHAKNSHEKTINLIKSMLSF